MIERRKVITLLALLVCGGCGMREPTVDLTPPTDTPATNAVRRTIGIREIKPKWDYIGRRFNEQIWMDPGHVVKKVKRHGETDKITWEIDDYFSGNLFATGDGDVEEGLSVYYDYRSSFVSITYFGSDPAVKKLMATLTVNAKYSNYDRGKTNTETLAIAVEILKMWNLSLL